MDDSCFLNWPTNLLYQQIHSSNAKTFNIRYIRTKTRMLREMNLLYRLLTFSIKKLIRYTIIVAMTLRSYVFRTGFKFTILLVVLLVNYYDW